MIDYIFYLSYICSEPWNKLSFGLWSKSFAPNGFMTKKQTRCIYEYTVINFSLWYHTEITQYLQYLLVLSESTIPAMFETFFFDKWTNKETIHIFIAKQRDRSLLRHAPDFNLTGKLLGTVCLLCTVKLIRELLKIHLRFVQFKWHGNSPVNACSICNKRRKT